jgi:ADP-ribosylglycohydrolase
MLGAIAGDVIGSVHERSRAPYNSWGNGSAMRVPAVLSARLADIRPTYRFTEPCQGTVPPALIAFLESSGYEDAVRKAISLGGDADTLACITGAVAEAHYGGVPADIASRTLAALDDRLQAIVARFSDRFMPG